MQQVQDLYVAVFSMASSGSVSQIGGRDDVIKYGACKRDGAHDAV